MCCYIVCCSFQAGAVREPSEINLITWHFTRDEGEKCDKNCWLRGISSRLSHLSQLFLFLSCAPLKFGHISCDSCTQRGWGAPRVESNTRYTCWHGAFSVPKCCLSFSPLAPFFALFKPRRWGACKKRSTLRRRRWKNWAKLEIIVSFVQCQLALFRFISPNLLPARHSAINITRPSGRGCKWIGFYCSTEMHKWAHNFVAFFFTAAAWLFFALKIELQWWCDNFFL